VSALGYCQRRPVFAPRRPVFAPRRPGRRVGVQVDALDELGRSGQLEREKRAPERESQIEAGIAEIRHGE
jgi:hypothetical protein